MAFAKYRKKSKIHRSYWGNFTIHDARYCHRQPPGNDHCAFYIMRFMYAYTGDDTNIAGMLRFVYPLVSCCYLSY
uniref:Ubiquitin-like protease family profile domain-containing protein n=1 Tax=Arundo donax TaxID=35708 RepID=A0A0A8YWI1_ARUDO